MHRVSASCVHDHVVEVREHFVSRRTCSTTARKSRSDRPESRLSGLSKRSTRTRNSMVHFRKRPTPVVGDVPYRLDFEPSVLDRPAVPIDRNEWCHVPRLGEFIDDASLGVRHPVCSEQIGDREHVVVANHVREFVERSPLFRDVDERLDRRTRPERTQCKAVASRRRRRTRSAGSGPARSPGPS